MSDLTEAPETPTTIPVVHDGEPVLSFAQERFWFMEVYAPGTTAYTIPVARRLRGAVDPAALAAALNRVAARHEPLRTRFPATADGRPVVVVENGGAIPLTTVDAASEDAARELVDAFMTEPFDLATGPVARAMLITITSDEHVFALAVHHIAADGWSTELLLGEVLTGLAGDPLPELPVRYRDFAAWQRDQPDAAHDVAYWREQLAGLAPLELPADRPRPPVLTYEGAVHRFTVAPGVVQRLSRFGRTERATPYMVLLAAFAILLGRRARNDDIAIGSPTAGRSLPELDDLIGCFVNMLTMRVDTSGDPTFAELVRRVRAITLGAFSHQDLPFEHLVRELDLPRERSRSPLFQVLFAMQNYDAARPAGSSLVVSDDVEMTYCTTRYDLELYTTGADDFMIIYNTALFDLATIERMCSEFGLLLEGIVADPQARISSYELLAPEERARWINSGTADELRDDPSATLASRFADAAARYPDAPALVAGPDRLSYAELDDRAGRLAALLADRGVRPGDRVAIAVPRSAAMIVAVLGVLRAGGTYVPLDVTAPAERLAMIREDAAVRCVVTTGAPARGAVVLDDPATVEQLGRITPLPPVTVPPAQAAYVIYTSGSTGRPKGVEVPHTAVLDLLAAADRRYELDSSDTWSLFHSVAFDVSVFEMWGAFAHGARLVVADQDTVRSPEAFWDLLERERVTVLSQTPSAFDQLMAAEPDGAGAALRYVIFAGEALETRKLRSWYARHPEDAPRLVNMYGITETTVHATFRELRVADADAGVSPVGRPLPGLDVLLLDRYLRPVPPGVVGEVYVRGGQLAHGYLGRPGLTASRFVADPARSGGRLYRSGDLARWNSDGELEFAGRADDQVKIRGFRVEPGEVEAALLALPGIARAVVVPWSGPGGQQLVAYVVGGVDGGQVREALGATLPGYMVPAAVVVLDAIPLTLNGKLDRRALPAPDFTPSATGREPATPAERAVAAAFAAILDVERVGADDSFFDLGGHSLLALRLAHEIAAAMGTEVSVRDVFDHPTVAGLAELSGGTGRTRPPLQPREHPGDVRALSAGQRQMWALHQVFGPSNDQYSNDQYSAVYNVPAVLRLRGPLDPDALVAAWCAVIARHEILRTVYRDGPAGPEAVVLGPEVARSRIVRERASAGRLDARIAAAVTHPFDLTVECPILVTLLELSPEEHVLVATLHHIAVDEWSWRPLLHDLERAYRACRAGEHAGLPAPAVQYADFAAWQRDLLTDPASAVSAARQLQFWREALQGAPQECTFPADRPRPAAPSGAGGTVPVEVGARLTAALHRVAREHDVTVFMLLHAALAVLLTRHGNGPDVVIGTPISTRLDPALDDAVGYFLNTLALRVDARPEQTLAELLDAIRTADLDAYDRPDVPFADVVAAIGPDRAPGRSPLFQVMLLCLSGDTDYAVPELPGLDVTTDHVGTGTAKFDATFSFHDSPDLLTGVIEYSTDLFDEATVARLADRYVVLLEGIVADPHAPISTYELLTPDERAQRARWNDTSADLGPAECLHRPVEEQARRTPDGTAVIHPGGQLSHAEVDRRSDHLAAQLTDAGVTRGDLVAVVMQRGWEQIVAVLAINKAGAAYLPVDADLPDHRRHELITRGGCTVALTQPALHSRLTWPDGLTTLSVTETSGRSEIACPARPGDLAYVIFTSGSTGTPKGVMIEHNAALNTVRDITRRFRVGPHDRVLALSALSFDLSVYDIYGTLAAGATLVMGRPEEDKDPAAWARIVAGHRITVWNSVPALVELLVDHAEHDGTDLSSLRLVMMSGDWIPTTLPDRIRALAPDAEIISLGGATEASIWSIFHPIGPVDPSWSSIPYGRPLANQQFHILDRGMRDVPIGVPGELHIGGAGVAAGYWRDPDRTAAAFVTHPHTGARLYRTGDLGRYHLDGTIEFLGRADTQVKIRGYRVELGEIEAHLNRHPDVAECVVTTHGTGSAAQLVAYVVAKPGHEPDPTHLRTHLGTTLPTYMIPTRFARLPRLPLTANGKVDRGRLSALEAPAGQESERTPPGTASERVIHAVWADAFGRDDVGIDDDFFELGGDSLLAIRVVARLRLAASGTAIAVMDLFTHPTIRRLAALLDGTTTAARGLLHRLTPRPATAPELSYVAVPYGGGGAIVYQPLADALPSTHALWSVAIPGHDIGLDEQRAPLEDVAARCVEEIQEHVHGPIALYGHCGVGSALVVEIARRLEAAGRVPEAVYIGAIFPFARPGRGLFAALGRLARHEALRSDRGYANWLTALGLDMSDIDPAQARLIVRNTRRDTEAAEEYFTELFERSVERLRAPVISVAGEHDPASEYYQERFREWHFLSDTTAVVLLDEAGHFFQKHRAAELAEIVTTTHPAIAASGSVAGDGWRLLDVSRAGEPDASEGPRPAVRRFLAVAAGQLVSITGSALTEFAIPIWIYLTTGSLVQFALFAVVGLVPGLLAAPLAGAVVDRSNRRTIMLAGDVGAGGTQLLLGVLLWTGNLQIWHIYPLLACLSVALTFQRLAYNSAVPQLVPKRYLGHVNGVVQMATGMSHLMVPVAAVGLMSVVGLEGILVLDVLSYAVAIAITLSVRFPRTMAWRRKESVTAEIKAGFGYSWGHARFRRMLIFFAVLNVFLSPLFLLISPLVLAVGTLTDVGRIAFGSGLAGVLGGLVMTIWGGPPRRRMRAVLLCTLGLAASCLVTGLRADLVTIGVGVFGMSLWLTVLNGIYATIVHVKVPQRFHGRVFALNVMIAWSTTPIGFGLVAPYGSALFEPLLAPGGALAPTVGALIGTGPGRGIALLYVLFAVAMTVLAVVALRSRLPRLVDDGPDATPDDLIGLQALGRAPLTAAADAPRSRSP